MRLSILTAGLLALASLVAACGGGDSNKTTGNGSSGVSITGAQPTPSGKATPLGNSPATNANSSLWEVTFTGALAGRWTSMDKTSSVNCRLAGDQLFASVTGSINNVNYGMGFTEGVLTSGNFVYPNPDNGSQKTPSLQLTTSTNSKAQWDMAGSRGKGNVTLSGAKGSPISAVFEGDMQDNNGGAPVHVQGSFRCTPATNGT